MMVVNQKFTECPNRKLKIISHDTGEEKLLDCKSYRCPYCGPRKRYFLQKGIRKELNMWQRVRFWTFTISNHGLDRHEHLSVLREAWRRLISDLKKYNFNFKYIKVFEPHKSGYTHIHVFMNVYVKFLNMKRIWVRHVINTINKLFPGHKINSHIASVFVTGVLSVSQAVFYVTKYIVKAVETDDRIYFQVYSKSRVIVFFVKYKSDLVNYEVYFICRSGKEILIYSNLLEWSEPPPCLDNIKQTLEPLQLPFFTE